MPPKTKHHLTHIDPAARETLSQFQGEGETDLFEMLAAVFQTSSEKYLTDLKSYASPADGPKIQAVAHSWKSSSYGIGAKDLGDLCARLEATQNDQDLERRQLIAAIETEYLGVRDELLKTAA